MKILYNGAISVAEAKRRLENERPNPDRTIWIEQKKGELYLELSRFRRGTTFRLVFTEEYVLLKYSGFFSFMNILLSILWCGGLGVGVLAWLILSIITQDWDRGGILTILAAGLPCFGFLWILILEDRILARKYVNKILGLNAKK